MRALVWLGVLWGALLGVAPAAADQGGRALLLRFECNRCHDGLPVAAAPREKHCVRCHQDILGGRFAAPPDVLQRWQGHLTSLNVVPSLTTIGQRLRRAWVASYLLAPQDLRPHLPATMPRLALSPQQAQRLAAYLVPAERQPLALAPAQVDEGRRVLDHKGCGTCHALSGAPLLVSPIPVAPVALTPVALQRGLLLAPDLAYTRARYQPRALLDWLRSPRALKPDAAMPEIALSAGEISAVAAYLLLAPLPPPPREPLPPRLPVLARRVGFAEVNQQVLQRTCWHCHSSPDYALGDGGPGNTGGFGFAPRGLSLADYSDVMAGSLDEQRQRRSVLAPLLDGTPRLVAHLLARQREVRGEVVAGVRGMPLGLPPLTPEQIQLVESWIAQGRPR